MTRDGRVAYQLQRPWRRGETHRVMDPVELLARLSALIPPPRHPLLRFHGVLAPHSSLEDDRGSGAKPVGNSNRLARRCVAAIEESRGRLIESTPP
jgi:hypothetical protein